MSLTSCRAIKKKKKVSVWTKCFSSHIISAVYAGRGTILSDHTSQYSLSQWNEKDNWKGGKKKYKYPNSLWSFQLFLSPASHIDQSYCLPNAPLMGLYPSQSEFQISERYTEMKNNMSLWKPDCEDLHCSFILENTKNPLVLLYTAH